MRQPPQLYRNLPPEIRVKWFLYVVRCSNCGVHLGYAKQWTSDGYLCGKGCGAKLSLVKTTVDNPLEGT